MQNKRHKDIAANDCEQSKELLTTGEVAEQLRVHKRTVQRWIASGRLTATKVGPRMWRIRAEDLNVFLGYRNTNEQNKEI